MEAALVVSVLSLLVSVVVAVAQYRQQSRIAAIEESRRREELSSQSQADVSAWIDKTINSRGKDSWRFILHNAGAAVARGVRFTMTPASQGDIPKVLTESEEGIDIHPGQVMPFPVALFMGVAGMLRIHLTWADDSGDHEKTLTISTYG